MHHHTTASLIAAFVLGLLLLPTLRWVDAAWFALLSKVFESRHDPLLDDQEDDFLDEKEDEYRFFWSANAAHKETITGDETSKADTPRVKAKEKAAVPQKIVELRWQRS